MTVAVRAPLRLGRGEPPRARRHGVVAKASWPLVGVVILGVTWEVLGRAGWLGTSFPPLSSVLDTFTDPNLRPVYRRAVSATLMRAARGYVVGAGLAIVVALLILLIPRIHGGVYRLAVVVSSIPFIALGPFFAAVMPRENAPAAAAAIAVFLAVLVTAVAGLNSAGAHEHDLFSVLGVGRLRRLRYLQIPASVPALLDGLKLAVPAAMLGAMIGEWFGSDRGLGVLTLSSMQNYRIDVLWASALLSASVSMLFFGVFATAGYLAARRYPRPANTLLVEDRPRSAVGSFFSALTPFWSVLLLLALWEWWVWSEDVPKLVLPPATAVLHDIVTNPSAYAGDTAYTALVSVLGLSLGMLLGAGTALLMSRFSLVRAMSTPAAIAFQSIPIVVVIPLISRLLGYGHPTVVVVAMLMSFFPSFVLIESGLRSTPPGSDDVFSVLGSGDGRRLRLLQIPSAIPNALVALRISAASCVLGALTAEWLIGQRGLGHLFAQARARLVTERSWGAIIVCTALAVTAFLVAGVIERRGRSRWS